MTAQNKIMVTRLERNNVIRSSSVKKAFLAIDRGFFVNDDISEAAYVDMPLRLSGVHLSAPGIYATVLEALQLQDGLSFLNIGSGSGYLSALASHILGRDGVHHGVEINPRLVDLSRAKLGQLGLHQIEVFHHSCFGLDFAGSMQYARIYIGAGASAGVTASLLTLLQVGGVLVGPMSWPDGSQQLIQARRDGEDSYDIHPILAVQFTPLIDPPAPPAAAPPAGSAAAVAPTRIARIPTATATSPPATRMVLRQPEWSPSVHPRFPPAHRAAVRAVLMLNGRSGCLLSFPPKELWTDEILPHIGFDAYLPGPERSAGRGSWARTLSAATRSLAALTGGDRGSFDSEPHEATDEDGGSSSDGGQSDGSETEDTIGETSEAEEALLTTEDAAPQGGVALPSALTDGHVQPAPPALPPASHEMLGRILQLLAHATSIGTETAASRPSSTDGADAPAPGSVPHRLPPVSQLW